MTQENRLLLKKSLTFWDKLTTDEQSYIEEHTHVVQYDAGKNIHSGDMDCLGIVIVKTGCIRSYILSEKGKDVTLFRLYPGELCILSASCILPNITFDVHIDVEEKSELLIIHSTIFSRLIKENIYIENFSYKIVMDKFSDVMWTMEQILFMSFDKRLAIFLLDEAHKRKTHIIPLTHEQIARYIGSAREVVSRMLKYFASEGLISLHRGEIVLENIPKLKSLTL